MKEPIIYNNDLHCPKKLYDSLVNAVNILITLKEYEVEIVKKEVYQDQIKIGVSSKNWDQMNIVWGFCFGFLLDR